MFVGRNHPTHCLLEWAVAGRNLVLMEVLCAVALTARAPWCQGLYTHIEPGRWSVSFGNYGFNRQKVQGAIAIILAPLQPGDAPSVPHTSLSFLLMLLLCAWVLGARTSGAFLETVFIHELILQRSSGYWQLNAQGGTILPDSHRHVADTTL